MNSEYGRICKEVAMLSFRVLSWHSLGQHEENRQLVTQSTFKTDKNQKKVQTG